LNATNSWFPLAGSGSVTNENITSIRRSRTYIFNCVIRENFERVVGLVRSRAGAGDWVAGIRQILKSCRETMGRSMKDQVDGGSCGTLSIPRDAGYLVAGTPQLACKHWKCMLEI
jgi:hypothetical protein